MPKRTHTDPLDEDEDEDDEDEDEDEEGEVGSLLDFRATQRTIAMAQRSTPRTSAVEDAVIRSLDERPVMVFALDEERADEDEGTEAARAASRSVVEEGETKIYFEGRPPPVYESNDDVVAKMRAKKPRTGAEIRGEALRLDAARRLKSTAAFDMSRVVGGVEREKKLYDERRRLGQQRG